MSGEPGAFPATRLSIVRAAQCVDPEVRHQGNGYYWQIMLPGGVLADHRGVRDLQIWTRPNRARA